MDSDRDEDQEMSNHSEAKSFPEHLKYIKVANGREKVKRDWVTYRKRNDALYCIPCVFLSKEQKRPSLSHLNSQDGHKTSDVKWRRMYDKFPDHEKNKSHRDCFFKWKNLKQIVWAGSGIYSHLQKQI